jgi:GTPase-activator protein for Ras-like GTPase
LKPGEDIDENWARLLKHIREVWNRILVSAGSCPPEFKEIFSKIQGKVIETAGNTPTITFAKYTCISAFIFLRFFMPACLNPSLHGIIQQPPDETQRRTLLLISKGLQGVSNMSGYGGKEKWILPMGTLSAEYEDQFTHFIDQLCEPNPASFPRLPAQYSGPAQIKSRLDPLSQEGIPNLPFLIDQPREFAGLVKLWNRQLHPPLSPTQSKRHSIDVSRLSETIRPFHLACLNLNMRLTGLVETAVEREEEDFSETDPVDEDLSPNLAELSLSSKFHKRDLSRKHSFSVENEYTNSPPKRTLDTMLHGLLRKTPSEKKKHER